MNASKESESGGIRMRNITAAMARRTTLILVLWSLTSTLVVSSYSSRMLSRANGSPLEEISKRSALARRTDPTKLNDVFGWLQLSFEANNGQLESSAQFFSRGGNCSLYLSPTEASFHIQSAPAQATGSILREVKQTSQLPGQSILTMKLEGSNALTTMRGLDELPGKTNYLLGNDRKDWRTNVATYARIEQKGVYPGVDLVYYGNQRQLEYDFRIAPGANIRGIKLGFEGALALRIDSSGDLVLSTPTGDVRQKKPFAYQEVDGEKREVASRYVLKGKHRVGFEVGRYDRSRALVIDPVLVYSSYMGFAGQPNAIAIDDSGNIYVTGHTVSDTLPVTPGAFQSARGSHDPFFDNSFVAKVNAAGNALIYLTYIAGNYVVYANDIVVDAGGNAYIGGSTASSNFPTTAGALKSSYGGSPCGDIVPLPGDPPFTPTTPCYEAFVTKLNANGTGLVYSTFLGGNLGGDFVDSMALDASGNIYVAGHTLSIDFPITPGAFQTGIKGVPQDLLAPSSLFVSKLNSSGSALIYSTYLGGSGYEGGTSVGGQSGRPSLAIDSQGNAYICGTTNSPDFPITPGALQTTARATDGFVTKLNPAGTALVYSTYLGGGRSDSVQGIAVDSQGSAYVTGVTYSANFPVKNAFQNTSSIAPFYRSSNAGTSWASRGIPDAIGDGDPLGDALVRAMVVAPDAQSSVYLGTINGLFKSVDHGDSWSASGLNGERVRRLTIDPHTSSTMYASTLIFRDDGQDDIGRLYKSVDGGNSWGSPILDGASFNAIVVDPANSSTIYVAAGALGVRTLSGILKSTDAGGTWKKVNGGLSSAAAQDITDLVIDPTNGSKLYAGTLIGVFNTANGGGSWSPTALTGFISSLQIDPRKPDTLYASTEEDDDDSQTTRLPDPDDGRFNPRRRQVQAAGSDNPGLFRTNNAGASWSAINNELGSNPFVPTIVADPRNPGTLYVTSWGVGSGIYKSLDRGDHWELLKGLNARAATLIAVDPQDSFVYASFLTGNDPEGFITKLDPSGTFLVYSTYIGGAGGWDEGIAIAVDSAGNTYVAGETSSDDFLVTAGAFQTTFVGSIYVPDMFVTKVSHDGNLLYSTYLGGNSYENARGIVVDSRGVAYVTGGTSSPNFPVASAFRPNLSAANRHDPFIAKLDMEGSPEASTAPRISNVSVSGKNLTVVGQGFKPGALILLAGQEQKTANDSQSPSTRLIGKKAGKKVKPGKQVMIQVKNPDGAVSERYLFIR